MNRSLAAAIDPARRTEDASRNTIYSATEDLVLMPLSTELALELAVVRVLFSPMVEKPKYELDLAVEYLFRCLRLP